MNLSLNGLMDLPRLLNNQAMDPVQEQVRIRYMERSLALPVKGIVISMLFYYLFFSNTSHTSDPDTVVPQELVLDVIRRCFLLYVLLNGGIASLLLGMERLPYQWVQRAVFASSWVDAVFLAVLTVITGGFDSILFWVFLGLIVRNAVTHPLPSRQITLNLFVTLCYFVAGVIGVMASDWSIEMLDFETAKAIEQGPPDGATEPFVLRLFLLILMTTCCCGVQLLFDRQRLAEAEAREFLQRQQQLQATGRLAAEIAHQLKNPLGIINNAAYTLQKSVKEGKKTITQQIEIIREEVDRSDRIITELMGYARLSEGKVERLDINEELDYAIELVFPTGADYQVKVHRDYAPALPPLLMLKGHLSEVIVNILQNAREAMNGKGNIRVTSRYGDNYSVAVIIEDDGPGIPADKLPNIFEPYFTTKEKGTGLGLAIVKHNTEIYGGAVEVQSELGKGTRFTINLPARTLMKIRK